MFRITVVTDDKKLPKLLRAFKGLILGTPDVFLLEGVEEVEGELHEAPVDQQTSLNGRSPHPWQKSQRGPKPGKPTKAPGTTLPDRVVAILLKAKPDVINASVLAEATEKAGSSKNSYSYVTVALRKWGILSGPTPAGRYILHEEAYHNRIEGGQ